jgi:hypothetical protein
MKGSLKKDNMGFDVSQFLEGAGHRTMRFQPSRWDDGTFNAYSRS